MKNFIKNKWMYLFSIISSFYFTYLICRLWELNKRSIFVIGLFVLIIFIFLTYLWDKKNIDIKKSLINKKKLVILAFGGGLILSIVTVFLNYNFFTLKYVPSKVEIINPKQEISLDIIDKILLNNQVYEKDGNKFVTTYDNTYNLYEKINENDIIIEKITANRIVLRFKKSHNVKIYFNNNSNNIIINDLNKNINLEFRKNQSLFTYIVKSNTISDQFSIIRFLLSLILLEYIYSMCIIYFIKSKMKEKYLLITIFISLAIGIVYSKNIILGTLTPDSGTYINYDFSRLFNLKLNGRTPIYPIIIKIIRKIFSVNFIEFVCILQYVIWFISLVYLYNLIILISKRPKYAFVGTILYALSSTIIAWNGIVLTESIALSGTIIFIYYIIKYIKTKKSIYGIICSILSLILTFHRPTCIIYLLALFIFFILKIIFEKESFKEDIKCLISTLLSIVVVIIYAILFHRTFGIYSISDAVVRQDLYVSIQEEYYKSSNDPEFIRNIEIAKEKYPDNSWETMLDVLGKYSLKETKQHTNYCRNQNIEKYIIYILDLFKEYSSAKFEGYSYISSNSGSIWLYNGMYSSFSIITFLHVYIIMLIQLLLSIKNWIIDRRVPWINLGFFAFPFIIVLSSFIGTCSEFMRTSIACVPFTYVSLIYLIYCIFERKNDVKC